MSKKIFFVCISILVLFLSGCATSGMFKTPYVITEQNVKIGKVEELHDFAGVYFSLYNNSSNEIESITVSFLIYDEDGQNPFIGSNCVISKILTEVSPEETKDFVVKLDSYISVVPEIPYQVDFFYVREICYKNGKKWQDPFGMHATREIYE